MFMKRVSLAREDPMRWGSTSGEDRNETSDVQFRLKRWKTAENLRRGAVVEEHL